MQINLFGRGLKLQIAITVACEMAFILFGKNSPLKRMLAILTRRLRWVGYDQGVFSGIVGNADFLNVVGHPNDSFLGIIVSIYNLGCFAGCILNFIVGEYLGRRRAMWVAMGFVIVCGYSILASVNSTEPLTMWTIGGSNASGKLFLCTTSHDRSIRHGDRHRY
jgi:MFS family permease